MADLIYCGTPPVGPAETREMLAGPFAAIWSPPMRRRASPARGDRLWLLWQAPSRAPLVLGGGRVLFTPEGRPDWTNRTAPGVVGAAKAVGYGGPTNMAFLRLTDVSIPSDTPEIHGLGDVAIGLSEATPRQADILSRVVPL